jgi:hypothetical protein
MRIIELKAVIYTLEKSQERPLPSSGISACANSGDPASGARPEFISAGPKRARFQPIVAALLQTTWFAIG